MRQTCDFPSRQTDHIVDLIGSSELDNQFLRFGAGGAEAHGSRVHATAISRQRFRFAGRGIEARWPHVAASNALSRHSDTEAGAKPGITKWVETNKEN